MKSEGLLEIRVSTEIGESTEISKRYWNLGVYWNPRVYWNLKGSTESREIWRSTEILKVYWNLGIYWNHEGIYWNPDNLLRFKTEIEISRVYWNPKRVFSIYHHSTILGALRAPESIFPKTNTFFFRGRFAPATRPAYGRSGLSVAPALSRQLKNTLFCGAVCVRLIESLL